MFVSTENPYDRGESPFSVRTAAIGNRGTYLCDFKLDFLAAFALEVHD